MEPVTIKTGKPAAAGVAPEQSDREGGSGRSKPPVDPSELSHRQLRGGPFWQAIPAYAA